MDKNTKIRAVINEDSSAVCILYHQKLHSLFSLLTECIYINKKVYLNKLQQLKPQNIFKRCRNLSRKISKRNHRVSRGCRVGIYSFSFRRESVWVSIYCVAQRFIISRNILSVEHHLTFSSAYQVDIKMNCRIECGYTTKMSSLVW